ncbi:hypothetical protein AKJ36_00085 [candidate division MSBL1 archaeon SCGC-AAA259I07]|uniref:PglZ domain-containing protein n=1 Tax=candidate division MSBL1 archaeon SCGC-AAA259I07 TaxID=1698266 RepID=A0A133UN18_9EURY|nr:hypothetical protein AKJ36_00085 [candidate division MSBL1 archaeon SCGC-AAA259I07]
MKIENKIVQELMESDNPFPILFEYLLEEIWTPKPGIKEYYAQEQEMNKFERFLSNVYGEIYSELLPRYCMDKDKNLDMEHSIILLDSLSLREAILLKKDLQEEGFDVNLSFSYSSLPSDTKFYKEKISYEEIKRKNKTKKIQDPDSISLEGDEDIIWSDFPDAWLENISAGRTKLNKIEDMFNNCKNLLFNILDQMENTPAVTITSDHGYVRSEAAYSFKTNESDQKELRQVMGGSRYKPIENANGEECVKAGYLLNFNGYYLAKERHTWTIGGKYEIFQHGGVSLLECLIPRLEVEG